MNIRITTRMCGLSYGSWLDVHARYGVAIARDGQKEQLESIRTFPPA